MKKEDVINMLATRLHVARKTRKNVTLHPNEVDAILEHLTAHVPVLDSPKIDEPEDDKYSDIIDLGRF